MSRAIPVAASFAVGALTAVQARINGQLAVELGNGLEAAVWSFGSGLVVLTVLAVVVPSIRAGVARIPRAVRSGRAGLVAGAGRRPRRASSSACRRQRCPSWAWRSSPSAVVAGQSSNSLLVDRLGLGPAGKQAITRARVIAPSSRSSPSRVAVSNRLGSGDLAPLAVRCSPSSPGVAIARAAGDQRPGRRRRLRTRCPRPSTTSPFGTLVLSLASRRWRWRWAASGPAPSPLPAGPWWLYLGGVIGHRLHRRSPPGPCPIVGVLLFAVVTIAGQLPGRCSSTSSPPPPVTDLGGQPRRRGRCWRSSRSRWPLAAAARRHGRPAARDRIRAMTAVILDGKATAARREGRAAAAGGRAPGARESCPAWAPSSSATTRAAMPTWAASTRTAPRWASPPSASTCRPTPRRSSSTPRSAGSTRTRRSPATSSSCRCPSTSTPTAC